MLRCRLLTALSLCACLLLAPTLLRAAGSRDALVVPPAWVAAHLKDAHLVILSVGLRKTYDAGHLPGAEFVPLESVSAPMDRSKIAPGDLKLEMPDAATLRAQLQDLGISSDSKIVVYYSNHYFSPTTRVIYALNYAGLGANTVLMDGGLRAWQAAGHPMSTDVPKVAAGTLGPLKLRTDLIVDVKFVQTTAKTAGFALVDGRAAAAFEGVPPPSGRGGDQPLGHIPGAVSVPFADAFNERDELRSPEELERLFAKAGVKPGDTIVGYCWIGQNATAMLFAAETLGHDVKLYDGSIDDWTNRKLPLEVVKKNGGGR